MTTESTLRAALQDLEVCANTVAGCYTRNPGNFAAALRDLQESAERARAALSAHPARASQEPYPLLPEPFMPLHGEVEHRLWATQLRAYAAADRAARPESVDALKFENKRLQSLVDRFIAEGRKAIDAQIDAAIAKGEQT